MKKSLTLFAMCASISFGALAADFNGYCIYQNCSSKAAMRGNVECANKCIKGGSAAVLVTDDGKIYKFDDQAKVLHHAGKKVTVTGRLKDDTITVAKVSE